MAKAKQSKPATYLQLNEELNEVLTALGQESTDIDQALKDYERGLSLIEQLKQYLETAENKVKLLQTKHRNEL